MAAGRGPEEEEEEEEEEDAGQWAGGYWEAAG